jgi:hypothetical protein
MRPVPNSGHLDAFGDAPLAEKEEIHSAKAHRCVDKVRAKGHSESSAWAICTSSVGKRGIYAKGHGGNANPKKKIHEAKRRRKVCEAREAAVATACRRFEQEYGRLTQEAWSDAARAASLAARRARAMGHNWKKAARVAFRKAVTLSQGFDPVEAFHAAAKRADSQSFPLLPRGQTGARGILKQARMRAEATGTSDRGYWAARKAHIGKALTFKARRFATA